MKDKMTKGKLYCIISAVLIFGAYILQRILNMTLQQTKTIAIAEALAFSILTAVLYFLLSRSDEPFYGILMAIFGIRMLPPDIMSLADLSSGADVLYFIVDRFSFVIFALSIIKLYREQKTDRFISPIPIISTIVVVPLFYEVGSALSNYFADISRGNMIYSYLTMFAVYSAAMISLLFIATRCSKMGARLICDFQLAALLLNAVRRVCAVIINLAQGNHISRSYYCWILIYVFFFIAFYIIRNRTKETSKA